MTVNAAAALLTAAGSYLLLFSLVSFKAGLKGDDKPQAAKALSGLVEAAKPVRPSLCVRALLMTGRGALTGLLARTRPEVVLAAGGQGCARVFSVEESISKDSKPYRDKRKDVLRDTCEHGEEIVLIQLQHQATCKARAAQHNSSQRCRCSPQPCAWEVADF